MRALYISHIGMAEPLGQSQVLPYLRGLSANGASIRILSFERAGTPPEAIDRVREAMGRDGLRWDPLVRSPAHGLGVKVRESSRAVLRGLSAAIADRPEIIHARSYLPAAAADVIASLSPTSRLLFDCRGMLGDEYIDNGQWTEDRAEYRLLKRFERRVFRRAEGVVVLTRALRTWLDERAMIGPTTHVEVIPCCVDMRKFGTSEATRREARAELGIGARIALVYSGSLGSWYLESEMARFAAQVTRVARELGRDVVVVTLSPSDPGSFLGKLADAGIPESSVIVRSVPSARMPHYLSAGDVGMSFIQSCFSKKGSSPTKVAEYLACGLVVALNGDIGDQADLAAEAGACVVVGDFRDETLAESARRAVALADRPHGARAAAAEEVARRHFDLETVGVPRYVRLYSALTR